MFWKDQLASEILASQTVTKTWLTSLIDRYPSLRVKTIDANGRVPVIQLNGSGDWLKPKEWATIHLSNLKQQHIELHQRLTTISSDPKVSGVTYGSQTSAGTDGQSDPSDLQQLQTRYDALVKSYIKAMNWLDYLSSGNEATLEMRTALASMKASRKWSLI